jgi:hypothetical protein
MAENKLNRKKILIWEMSGILFIIMLGSALHFIFEISGGMKAVALIGAVNESVWEHLKIGFWPAFIWAVVEFFVFGKKAGNFLMAKGVSFTLLSILIAGIYYASEAIGIEGFIIHAVNFTVSIAISQIVSYRIILTQKYSRVLNIIGSLLVIINIMAFSLLTYFPLHLPLFKDPITGGYGIF